MLSANVSGYRLEIYIALSLVEILANDTDVTIILSIISMTHESVLYLNKNRSRSVPTLFRHLWVIQIFRSVPYLLNMICLKLFV